MMLTQQTAARGNFQFFLNDVDTLIRDYDTSTGKQRGRPRPELEVYKRSALILLVTAWETFIEDTLTEQFAIHPAKVQSPSAIQGTFNAVAQAWLEKRGKIPLTPTDLQAWAGDGWRRMIVNKFKEDVASLNTPNAEKVGKLFKRYLNTDITQHWKWRGKTAKAACDELDKTIQLRGELVHRGRELFERKSKVMMKQVKDARKLIERLVQSTEMALAIAPKNIRILRSNA